MSANIISFPLRASTGLDQQRWIPAPRARQAQARSGLGWLRLSGILFAGLSSWALVIGAARLVATVL
jgi:hypothetical protein